VPNNLFLLADSQPHRLDGLVGHAELVIRTPTRYNQGGFLNLLVVGRRHTLNRRVRGLTLNQLSQEATDVSMAIRQLLPEVINHHLRFVDSAIDSLSRLPHQTLQADHFLSERRYQERLFV
jgi:hypothetical protein